MFITKESDYAVRIIRELKDGERKTVEHICRQENIPFQYGYKILKKLEMGGLVRSYRGANGGYALAKEPVGITLFDVITAINEELLLFECLGHGFDCPRNRGENSCGVHSEFGRIQGIMLASLKEKPLSEFV
jgi:Rrf2 family protein